MASAVSVADVEYEEGGVESEAQQDVAGPPPKPDEVLALFNNISKWIDNGVTKEGDELFKAVIQDWVTLTGIFKHHYSSVKSSSKTALILAVNTMKKTKELYDSKSNRGQKTEPQGNENRVCCEALRCMSAILIAVNQDPELEPGYKEDSLELWKESVDLGIYVFLRVDVSTACALLDVFCNFGKDVFTLIQDGHQKRLMVFVSGYADDTDLSAVIRAKIGRLIAKMVESPPIREDVGFIMDALAVTKKNFMKGENNVKSAYAWTFANLTDVLVDLYMDAGLENKARSFVMDLLETTFKSTEVPIKARYSSCRACGNIFKWLTPEMLINSDYQTCVRVIVNALMGMIGEGMDYKLRWNAARAIGQIIEDDKFLNNMTIDVTGPVVRTLSKWVAQSQNYKERIQCVISLAKVKTRPVYGNCYSYLWDRICMALARLPVEDSENLGKFKVEILLLIFNLIRVVRMDDLDGIDATIGEHYDLLTSLVLEHVTDVPLERMGVATSAKETIDIMKKKTKGTYVEGTVATLSDIMYLSEEVDMSVLSNN